MPQLCSLSRTKQGADPPTTNQRPGVFKSSSREGWLSNELPTPGQAGQSSAPSQPREQGSRRGQAHTLLRGQHRPGPPSREGVSALKGPLNSHSLTGSRPSPGRFLRGPAECGAHTLTRGSLRFIPSQRNATQKGPQTQKLRP